MCCTKTTLIVVGVGRDDAAPLLCTPRAKNQSGLWSNRLFQFMLPITIYNQIQVSVEWMQISDLKFVDFVMIVQEVTYVWPDVFLRTQSIIVGNWLH